MNINKIKPATRFILNELQEKHTVFELEKKVNINLQATRQVVFRLIEDGFVYVCESKLDGIKKRQIKYYKTTEKGKKFLKTIEETFGEELKKPKEKKNFLFGHHISLGITKAFIKTLKEKATPWDALLKQGAK